MIKNFEQETHPLSETELNLAAIVAKSIKKYVGKDNAITADKMAKALIDAYDVTIDGARMRKIMNHIRMTGLCGCVLACSKGYYIADTKEEMSDYLEGLFSRAFSQFELYNSLYIQGLEAFSSLDVDHHRNIDKVEQVAVLKNNRTPDTEPDEDKYFNVKEFHPDIREFLKKVDHSNFEVFPFLVVRRHDESDSIYIEDRAKDADTLFARKEAGQYDDIGGEGELDIHIINTKYMLELYKNKKYKLKIDDDIRRNFGL